MNELDFLDILGEVKGSYIMEAQRHREGVHKRLSLRKPLLIAVAVAMTLLLAGCAVVYALRLADTILGVKNITVPGQSWNGIEITPDTEETRILRSIQGTVDGPNNQAMQEWLAFRDSYDQDKSLMIANDRNESGIPEKYYYNGCYTWDMVAKMDEILAKYDLDLLTDMKMFQQGEYQKLLDDMNISGIFREGAAVESEPPSGYYYKEGTFDVSAVIALKDAAWKHQVFADYRYSVKAYLDMAVGLIDEDYEEWDYTTSDGVKVLLTLSDRGAEILCDRGAAFITVGISPWFGVESFEGMKRSDVEQFAEVFDFSLIPQPNENAFAATEPTTPETGPTEWTEAIRPLGDIISEYLEFAYYPDQMKFAFMDVDGDYTDELVLRIVDKDESVSLQIYEENDTMQNRFNMVRIDNLCENYIVESHFVSDTIESEYFTPTETGMRYVDSVAYSCITEQWMRDRDGRWGEEASIISEEEAREIIDSYKHIEPDWKPISQFNTN